ncbi:MAG: DUF507 family protein [Bdellovibrionales bacterium]
MKQLESDSHLVFQQKPEDIRNHITSLIQENFQKEKELEEEVHKMMDDLENQGHSFERHKMYPELKRQLAKKRGFIV